MLHAGEPRPLLVVRLDDRPGRIGCVRVEEHRLLGLGIGIPLVERGPVDRRQLPLLERIGLARLEALALLVARHREPVFEQPDSRARQHLLELGALTHELEIVGGRAEAHDPLDAGPVVPGAVEQGELTGRRQMGDIALEIPLGPLALVRLGESHDARGARIHVLHVALDRAALARGIAALEQHDDPLAALLDPALRLEQFALQLDHVRLVRLGLHAGRVRIFAALEQAADHRWIALHLGEIGTGARRLARRLGGSDRAGCRRDRADPLQRLDRVCDWPCRSGLRYRRCRSAGGLAGSRLAVARPRWVVCRSFCRCLLLNPPRMMIA